MRAVLDTTLKGHEVDPSVLFEGSASADGDRDGKSEEISELVDGTLEEPDCPDTEDETAVNTSTCIVGTGSDEKPQMSTKSFYCLISETDIEVCLHLGTRGLFTSMTRMPV